MKITKQNYERFLIDFMDGVLDPSVKELLFDFLNQNPEIKAAFDDLEIINAAIETNISFDRKDDLKKPQIESTENIRENNYEEYFIASAETDLTNAEEKELEQFMSLNPNLTKNHQLFKRTKVQADLSINYPDKNALKKYPFYQRKVWYYTASAAASILIFISLWFFNKSDNLRQTNYAQESRIAAPESMGYIAMKMTITIPTEDIKINYRAVSKHSIAILENFNTPIEEIQKLQTHNHTAEQLASLKVDFQAPLFIPQKNLRNYPVFIHSMQQTNYAQAERNKKPLKAIWKGLFAQFKNNKRKNEGGSENGNAKRVGSLWVLASIGLERVNEVTGSNMHINSKIGEGSEPEESETIDLEISRSAN